GQLAVTNGTISTLTAGAGYGVAPIALIPAPPPAAANANGVGGIQASGYFSIASGTVSAFTFTNPGAGYPAGFTIVAQPNPYDPNLATGITLATVGFSLTNSGALTGVLCTGYGSPLANGSLANITLTVGGVGTQATVSAIVAQTIVTASVTGSAAGYGSVGALLTTFGGAPAQGTFTNSPDYLYLGGKPRPADVGLTVTGTGLTGTIAVQAGAIYDGGFFYSAPNAVIVAGANGVASPGTLTGGTYVLTMGSRPDLAILQPAP